MSSDATDTVSTEPVTHELKSMQKQWWCFLLLGVAMVVLGMIALRHVSEGTVVSPGIVVELLVQG